MALSAFGAGLLFGAGLWLSGMADPRKVKDFLDITGTWDPSLLLVMGGAVAVTLLSFGKLIRLKNLKFPTEIDWRLVSGSALFGVGWGLSGYCPGPALTALSGLSVEVAVFVAAMVAGGLFAKITHSSGPGA